MKKTTKNSKPSEKIKKDNNIKTKTTKNKQKTSSSKIKTFLANKKSRYIIIALLALIIIIIILLIVFKKEEKRFTLNKIYDIYPEEVRKLYTNVVETSCHGDLHLDIKMEDKEVKVADINKNNILDYLFSNIDKNEGLKDKMEVSFVKKRQDELFYTDINLIDSIKNYQYGDYVYNVEGNKITRKKQMCESDMKYVAFLYGYSYKAEMLTMNVNIAYKKGDKLYDLSNKELGKYTGDQSELFELTKSSSYYRFNYVKQGNTYKLDNVRWMNRS